MIKMKFLFFVCFNLFYAANAQEKAKPLPVNDFLTLRDSTTSMDIIFLKGEDGSISVEGRNLQIFNSFFENKPADKKNTAVDGTIMWLINGKEFISGNYFLGDSIGYVVFQKNGEEFINQINARGNAFLKSSSKQ